MLKSKLELYVVNQIQNIFDQVFIQLLSRKESGVLDAS